MSKMNELLQQLLSGENYFGSSSTNTAEFNKFYRDFKKEFHLLLSIRSCTDIRFKKNHFYISGNFSYKGQKYYFSLGDVRWQGHEPMLLYRTVRDYQDFTGDVNQYVHVGNDMVEQMNLRGK